MSPIIHLNSAFVAGREADAAPESINAPRTMTATRFIKHSLGLQFQPESPRKRVGKRAVARPVGLWRSPQNRTLRALRRKPGSSRLRRSRRRRGMPAAARALPRRARYPDRLRAQPSSERRQRPALRDLANDRHQRSGNHLSAAVVFPANRDNDPRNPGEPDDWKWLLLGRFVVSQPNREGK